ncbi:hypothetical protein Poli38472_012294 [Pythium oligandrum]|uniref:WW domain-containing protein n=1 Tax=Pythium oligandrum TaxID=41045 RepID=A0A8K1CRV1_PYTOL|nr:hypothetical protein Poli38472_012294 [Pythium oligandrum]|eukprot:TMW67178.1 hypothetical protein Poli38472_012294 [Pythium oligandrum]
MSMTPMRAATASPAALWAHGEMQRVHQTDRAHANVSVDALVATMQRHVENETRTFGWELHYDADHEVEYFVHSYTGEVRWPESRRTEGVMLREHVAYETSQEWGPYRHQAVWLPSGPTATPSAARFPVFAAMSSGLHPVQLNFSGWNILQESSVAPNARLEMMTQGHRILPPTWEPMHNGSPFLSRYPVFVSKAADYGAQYEDKENEHVNVLTTRSPPTMHNSAHGSSIATASSWRSLFPVGLPSENQQSPQRPRPAVGPAPTYAASAPTYAKKKEHNRRGYSLRLQRKQLKMEVAHSCGSSNSGNTIEPDHSTRVSVASKAS